MNDTAKTIENKIKPERLRLKYLTDSDYKYLNALKLQFNGNQTHPITIENTLFRRMLAEIQAVHDGTE